MTSSATQSAFSKWAGDAAYLMRNTGAADLFERLLKLVSAQLKCGVLRVDYQLDGKNEARLVHADQISVRRARTFNDTYLSPAANSVLIGEIPSSTVKQLENGDGKLSVLCAPIVSVDQVVGAVTAVALDEGEEKVSAMLSRLDSLATLASAAFAPDNGTKATTGPSPAKAIAETAHFESPDEFAYSLVNQLAAQMKAETVAMGIETGKRVRVLAVSGVAELKPKTPGVTRLSQVMEECLDRAEPVVGQVTSVEGLTTLPIHGQYSTESQNAAVCSIPLVHADNIGGVLTFQRSARRPFQADELQKLSTALAPYGNALKVLDTANRSLGRHVADSCRGVIRRNRTGWRLVLLLLIGTLVGWLCLGTLSYKPLCRTRVLASDLRHHSAPFGGKLKEVHAKPGQLVARGQVLAVFDTVELRLKLNSLRREVEAKEIEKRYAIEADELPQAALHRAEILALQSRIDSVAQQINDAKITADVDGHVMLADLEQRIGQVFQQGDPLIQIAPRGDWTLEVEVPDDVISYVAPLQTGSFAASALPTHRQEFKLEHIDGTAQVIDDRNVFVARGKLNSRPVWMRSGMEGIARIDAGRQPAWWVCFHTAVDWLRTNFWL